MDNLPGGKKAAKSRPTTAALPARDAGEDLRIRDSMKRWRTMDEPARRLGRGLGMKALIERVALEVGASMRQVQSALKPAGAD